MKKNKRVKREWRGRGTESKEGMERKSHLELRGNGEEELPRVKREWRGRVT